MVDPQHAGRLIHPRADLRFRNVTRPERTGDVLEGSHVRVEGVVLERHAHVAMLRIHIDDRPVVDGDVACVRLHHAGNQPQKHGLAAARRAADDQELALFNVDRQVADDLVVLKGLAEASDLQESHRSLLQPLIAPRLRPSTR